MERELMTRDWFEKDFYAVLGVAPDATADQLRRAYRQLAREHHPDTGAEDDEQFKAITAAYEVLGDEALRGEYDEVRALIEAGTVGTVGTVLGDRIAGLIGRFIAFRNEEQLTAVTLWALHTWLFEAFDVSPFLSITSPTLRVGKSHLLDALAMVVKRPAFSSQSTPAGVFRQIDAQRPTLLVDESDEVFAALRGILNGSYDKEHAVVMRADGAYSTYCPKALVALDVQGGGGNPLPQTVVDRAIPIRMLRRRPDQEIERLTKRRKKELRPQIEAIRAGAHHWAGQFFDENGDVLPEFEKSFSPEELTELNDRSWDSWEVLLVIANLLGGDWPDRARRAALLVEQDREFLETLSAGELLVQDVLRVFKDERVEQIASASLVVALTRLPQSVWARRWPKVRAGREEELLGEQQELADLLKGFGVRPKVLHSGRGAARKAYRGYDRVMFEEVWSRYVPGYQPHQDDEAPPARRLRAG